MAQKRNANLYNLSANDGPGTGSASPYASSGRNTAYIDGNTVRRAEEVPKEKPREKPKRELTPEEQREQRLRQAAARRNRRRAQEMSLGYTVFLTCASLVCALFLGFYVYLQSGITTHISTISSLQEEISDLKAANDSAEARIESSVSLDDVKAAAAGSLGLDYPDSDQIYTYTLDSSDYMNQYSSIDD